MIKIDKVETWSWNWVLSAGLRHDKDIVIFTNTESHAKIIYTFHQVIEMLCQREMSSVPHTILDKAKEDYKSQKDSGAASLTLAS